jgi:carboxyl-terminal processing protease
LGSGPRRRPFEGEPRAVVVLPAADPTLGGNVDLMELERAAFEAELGAPVELAVNDPGAGARVTLELAAEYEGPATVAYRAEDRLVAARAADVEGLFESLNLLRSVLRAGGAMESRDCVDLDEAIGRISDEVGDTYPAFALRGLDWRSICEAHADRVRQAEDPLAALQRWLAELEDGHTWVWPALGNLPYAIRVADDEAVFVRVRDGSAGEEAGVEPGWRLVELDGAAVDAADWLRRAAAPPHSRPFIAGRRLLAGPAGRTRILTGLSPEGERVTWEDTPAPRPAEPLVSWRRLSPAAAYLRVEAWVADAGVEERIDAAFEELCSCESLVLDLLGNPGGNLVLASRTRDRFLRKRTDLGSIRYSVGAGELSRGFPLVGEPASPEKRWPGRLIVLTDELTFSSSEDFLLGLQGLDHVRVVGRRSGGGSGRPRSLRLLPGWTLTVSTALTYDRDGHCVEGSGVPVDVAVSGSDEDILRAAEAL